MLLPILSNKIKINDFLFLFSEIIKENKNRGSLTEEEKVVNTLLEKVEGIILSQRKAGDNLELLVPLWRTLFETGVIFKIITSQINLKQNNHTYNLLLKRIIDLDIIMNDKTVESRKLEKLYRDKKKEETLLLDYDWSNPLFSEREQKNFSNPNHPSFRDLILRTKESTYLYNSMIDNYSKASSIIHFSIRHKDIISEFSDNSICNKFNYIYLEVIIDYLNLVHNLYKSSNSKQLQLISKRAIDLSQIIKRGYVL